MQSNCSAAAVSCLIFFTTTFILFVAKALKTVSTRDSRSFSFLRVSSIVMETVQELQVEREGEIVTGKSTSFPVDVYSSSF